MAQFTFIELHFEDGSIPVPDALRAPEASEARDGPDGDDADDSGGRCPGRLALGLLVVGAALAIGWKLLGDDRGEALAEGADDAA